MKPIVCITLAFVFIGLVIPLLAFSQAQQVSEAEKVIIQASGAMWKKDFQGAEETLSKLLAGSIPLDDDRAKAFQTRARAREALGNVAGAHSDAVAADEIWSRLILVRPSDSSLYFFRGTTRRTAGNLQGAIDDFNVALKMKPGNSEVLHEIDETKKLMSR